MEIDTLDLGKKMPTDADYMLSNIHACLIAECGVPAIYLGHAHDDNYSSSKLGYEKFKRYIEKLR